MRYLLDTHTLLWIVEDNQKLSQKAKQIYLDKGNDLYLSAASIWEMAIKISLRKLSLEESLPKFIKHHVVRNSIQILNILPEHIYPLVNLPFHHRDPFDRIIASQCINEKIPLVSKDKNFDQYPLRRIW